MDDGVNEGNESPGDIWLGIEMAGVKEIWGVNDTGEVINKSFVSMVICWAVAFCRDPSEYCTFGGGVRSQSSSNENMPSSIAGGCASLWLKR
jgi:hypothetical protein